MMTTDAAMAMARFIGATPSLEQSLVVLKRETRKSKEQC
jgi:hypothetical protein